MASDQELRHVRDRPAKAGRRAVPWERSPLADLAIVTATTSLASAQLAGVRGEEVSSGPAFRQRALSSPQSSASNDGMPAPHICSEIGGSSV